MQRDSESASRILKIAPSLASKHHEGGWFPLHAAVLSGDSELVKLVLSQPDVIVNGGHGSAIDSTIISNREQHLKTRIGNTRGATPLHYACMIGNLDIINLLVRHGSFFDILDDEEREAHEYFDELQDVKTSAAFHKLSKECQERECFIPCRDYASIDDLAHLIRKNRYDLFERLSTFQSELQPPSPELITWTSNSTIRLAPSIALDSTYNGSTLLHLAVIRQRRSFVELLLSVDPSVVNKVDNPSSCTTGITSTSIARTTLPHEHIEGATPLHYACLMQDLEIMELLLKAGADRDIKDYRGRKPEDLFCGQGARCKRMNCSFARLRDAEEKRRKANGEEVEDEGASERDEKAGFNSEKDHKDSEEENADEKEDAEQDSYESCTEDSDGNESDVQTNDNQDKTTRPKMSNHSLLSLEKVLGEKLVGQRGPIRSVANAIRLRESGWVDPDRPLTMLFLGSSGVGKTELAKQLSLYIHGKDGLATNKGETVDKLEKEYAFVRIDMSEYQEHHTAFNLIGAPKSYVGYDDGGALTQPLKKNPKAIVLLDEVEKAHPDVLTLFLQVFDDGRITDSKDGVICCKDAIFIMTSNVASSEIKEKAPELRRLVAHAEEQGRPEIYMQLVQQFTRSIHPILKQALKRDEFLGRINEMAIFLPLSEEDIELVVKRELIMWRKRADEKHKIKLRWTDEVRKLAAAYNIHYGVRSVASEVQRVAIQLVAGAQMKGEISENSCAKLTTNELGDIILDDSER